MATGELQLLLIDDDEDDFVIARDLLAEAEGAQDVFLRGRGLDLAMDGDRVQARVRPERDGRLAGEPADQLVEALGQ